MRQSGTIMERMKDRYFCYAWIAPFFIVFGIFQLYPMLYGFFLSLTKWDGFTPNPTFIGIQNYITLFQDETFWETAFNTFVIWILIVPVRTFLALLLATIVNSKMIKRGRMYSFFFLLPNRTAIVVVAILFRVLFTTNGGLVNVLLTNILPIEPIQWLDSTAMSKVSIALMNIWRGTGYFMIVMLAGLQKIPTSVYEAARTDGASSVRIFFQITLPMMKDVIIFVAMISTIWIFQNIEDAMVLTNGGPLYSSTPLILYMYRNAFEYFKLGYSSAITYVLFAILFVINYFVVKFQGTQD